jgi:hypothetical protein
MSATSVGGVPQNSCCDGSDAHPTTVDIENGAVYEGTFVTGEIDGCAGDRVGSSAVPRQNTTTG